ncbi:SRPBCC family protein [Nonomuraea roseola]|uniref:SRPBCC domain-containing protein n=1 Tax=Nonomuraea roseola TaxID=46179 RepID=A0ABV5QEU1_9ACTN
MELGPYERIVFTFGWEATPEAPDIPPGTTRVEVTLTQDGEGTRLILRDSGLPDMLEQETGSGWAAVLGRLARARTGADGLSATATPGPPHRPDRRSGDHAVRNRAARSS